MTRIGGFSGVRQDINPSRLEPGQLQQGKNLRFIKAGQIETLKADTDPYDAIVKAGVGSLVHGLHHIRNPFSGTTGFTSMTPLGQRNGTALLVFLLCLSTWMQGMTTQPWSLLLTRR
jgi:hypothetical protein